MNQRTAKLLRKFSVKCFAPATWRREYRAQKAAWNQLTHTARGKVRSGIVEQMKGES